MEHYPQTFTKAERITSKLLVDRLFDGGGASFVAFPFRIVYMPIQKEDAPVSILISIPKKRFHHAVDRNRIKRQIRESYRLQKSIVWKAAEENNISIAIAFISIAQQHYPSNMIYKTVNKALTQIADRIRKQTAKTDSKDTAQTANNQ